MKLERHNTQLAAERASEAELNRRGISTAKTDGNEPGIDLVAIHAKGRLIPIEVKGQQNNGNDWFITPPKREDTIYILVRVPTTELDRPGAFEFFIMSSGEIKKAMAEYLEDRHCRGTPDTKWRPAIRWRDAVPHKDRWDKLTLSNLE